MGPFLLQDTIMSDVGCLRVPCHDEHTQINLIQQASIVEDPQPRPSLYFPEFCSFGPCRSPIAT